MRIRERDKRKETCLKLKTSSIDIKLLFAYIKRDNALESKNDEIKTNSHQRTAHREAARKVPPKIQCLKINSGLQFKVAILFTRQPVERKNY